MYNRILNRPMFKLGGDTIDAQGTGITSGLDTPRNNYFGGGTIGGGMIHGNPIGNRTGFKEPTLSEQLSRIDVGVPESTRKRAFWSGIGQGFGSNPRTLGEALSGAVATRDQVLGPAETAAGKRKYDLELLGITAPYERETALMVEETKKRKLDVQYRIERLGVMGDKKRKSLNESLNQAEGLDEMAEIRKQIQALDSFLIKVETEILRKGKPAGQTITELASAILKGGFVTDHEEALRQAAIIYEGAKAVAGEVDLSKATGGRVGYQLGAGMQGVQPTEVGLNVDETIQTPTGTVQEDVSIRENIQPSVNMTYQEFRAKMPPQVDDEIVQLIYYNQDAFADFAQIKTQDEVYVFNNKWGVSLVLPFDTETT